MSNSADVAQLYKNVIEEVIRTVRNDFVNMGVDEQVLVDLQQSWEQKLVEANVFNAIHYPITANRDFAQQHPYYYGHPMASASMPTFGVHGNVPLSVGYQAAAPMPTVMNPLYGQRPNMSVHVMPSRPAPMPSAPQNNSLSMLAEAARPSTSTDNDTPPASSTNFDSAQSEDEVAAPTTTDATTKPQVPYHQLDGAHGADADSDAQNLSESSGAETEEPDAKRLRPQELPSQTIAAPTTTPAVATKPAAPKSDNSDELNSDLDDEDDVAAELDDENINDLILCQYEKINRVRSRWRGVLRAGTININGLEYAFSKATMDFEW